LIALFYSETEDEAFRLPDDALPIFGNLGLAIARSRENRLWESPTKVQFLGIEFLVESDSARLTVEAAPN
jgi:hypothetical protein